MRLIADRLCVCPRCRDEEVKRLHTRIARAFRHNIKELAVRLRVQFVEYNTVNVEAMLRIRLCRKHLIEAVRWQIHHPLLGGKDLHPLTECGTHPHHIGGYLEHDARLLPISGAAVDFGTFLAIAAAKKQCDGGSQLAPPVLLPNIHICRIELPIAIRL